MAARTKDRDLENGLKFR